MPNARAYLDLLAASGETGWPEKWPTDLTRHDHEILLRPDAPATFGWAIRQYGTHLFFGLHAVDWVKAVHRFHSEARFYWYDGQELKEITPEQLISNLEAQIRRER